MSFPTDLDDLYKPTSADYLGSPSLHNEWHDDEATAIEALEVKVGINGSAVTTSHDHKLSGVTGTDKAVSKTGTETLTNKTLTSPTLNTPIISTPTMRSWDGWQDANETWTYASATSITVPTNATTKYSVGDKIRFQNNDSGTYLYAYVTAVAATTLTVIGDTVPNATLTDNYYSKQTSPVGFPQWFSWTPTLAANGSMTYTSTSITYARFSIIGRVVKFMLAVYGTTGGSASTGLTFTLPATPAKVIYIAGVIQDTASTVGYASSAAAVMTVNKVDNSNWGLGASRYISMQGFYEI